MIGPGLVFLSIIMVIGGILLMVSDYDFRVKIGKYEGSAGFLLIIIYTLLKCIKKHFRNYYFQSVSY